MKTFIEHVLGHSPNRQKLGVFGKVAAYYGCVEAQGRGSLHCHMMVWIKGGMDPNAIRQRINELHDEEFCRRLITYLDDCIINEVPPKPPDVDEHLNPRGHPCQRFGDSCPVEEPARQLDMHDLVKECQTHRHEKTCYKYWKGPPEPKKCRFDLDPDNVRVSSEIDDNGNILLRAVDGMINNYNKTTLECVRCNMDVKFIASGPDAKAIMYYITDYVTKSPLSAHASYVALESAVKRLKDKEGTKSTNASNEETVGSSDSAAASLVQRCAFSMLSNQEMSAQQVASELLDLEDHFT
ncbi:hypothetical protein SISSUDRAFT_995501 [Sistotremastrum suecicum HHB10207 ss-3]|uniref:Helitron helicase-like domain-containing protein n=1 Tax=Sistotremastrum suecicum HHB10207 ss-3 TaxID=1314776 RepID=A0A165WGD8_9AGAM|nr:hypothetical protein SISSUDRAFT_995501 [Sistotremastrum suecicum HHB10207 ss-3]